MGLMIQGTKMQTTIDKQLKIEFFFDFYFDGW